MDAYLVIPLITGFLSGGLLVWIICSVIKFRNDCVKMLRKSSQKNSETSREQSAEGEMNREGFNEFGQKKFDYRRITLNRYFILIVLAFFIASVLLAYNAYIYSAIDCNQPLSYYPPSYGKRYLVKCYEHSRLFMYDFKISFF